jgi:nucleoside-diphosphate-sugar epimerase
LNIRQIEAVNIDGTKNVLKACVACGVAALVYTSTFNVVFGGQEIVEGREEDLPYFPLDKHVDHYSRTKAIAEQAVLAANSSRLLIQCRRSGEDCEDERLKTCALRCAGIYGEGEQRHLPRIVSYIERGLFQFTYGSKDSLVEFLHGDNFVQAHVGAACALQKHNSPVVRLFIIIIITLCIKEHWSTVYTGYSMFLCRLEKHTLSLTENLSIISSSFDLW